MWSNKLHAVFNSELLNNPHATVIARGGVDILPLSVQGSGMQFILSSSFVSQTFLRDQFVVANLIPGMNLVLDTIFLPGFPEYQDTGILYTTFPFNARAGLLYNYLVRDRFQASVGLWLGGELVPGYGQLYWGVEHSLGLRLLPSLLWGLKLQAAELDWASSLLNALFNVETGLGILLPGMNIFLSYLLEEQYHFPASRQEHSVKLGLVLPLPKQWSLNGGFVYHITSPSWMASLGLEMGSMRLFAREFFLSSAVSYQPVAGFSIHLSARWGLKPAAQ